MRSGRWCKRVAAALLLALVQVAVLGQALHFNTSEIEYNNQPVKVKSLYQDKQGYVWLGTSQGLLRHSGTVYQPFFLLDDKSNTEPAVSAVYEDAAQQLWVGYENGTLARKTDRKLIPVLQNEKHNSSPVAAILQGKDKTIWVATYGQGIFYGKDRHFYHLSTKQGLPDDYTYTLAEDKTGRIWVGTDRGIAIITLKNGKPTIEVLNSSKGLPDNIVTAIVALPNGEMGIGMQSAGFTRYSLKSKQFQVPPAVQNWNYGSITKLQPHHNGIWVGTDTNGLFWLGKDFKTLTPATPETINLKVTDFITDSEGQIWVASNTPTIYRANLAVRKVNDIKQQRIHAVLAARDNSLWFATADGLFRKKEGSPEKAYLNSRDKYQVVSLYEDMWGYIWVGTMGQGVLRLNPETGKYKEISTVHGLVNENVLSITGKGDELWLATLGGVSKCVVQGNGNQDQLTYSFQNFTQQDGLGINYIYQAFADSKNRVWFATDGKGLTMLQNGKFTNFSKDVLKSKTIYSITEDNKGQIWFSTLNDGVYRYDGKTFKNYNQEAGLRDLNITGIAADKKGNILLLNRQGLDVLNPTTNHVLFYGKDAGIDAPDADLNVVSTGADGKVWFGTQHGMINYSSEFAAEQLAPNTKLQDAQVFFKSVMGEKQHAFAYDRNHFTFDYTGLWYQNPEDVTYRVKLNGYDRDWTESRNATITYPNLPPGKYSFQVMSSATNLFPNREAVSYPFEIKPPFWRTYWFYALTLLGSVSGLYLFIKGREKRLRATERQEKDKVMFQFETLKSQVNPHFLFNSFNTLISTIEEDPDAAVVYVEHLSDFFRVMLTLREKNLIPLQEELDLIRDYVFLQQQRYRENLQVTIDVPQEALSKQVAPLTLQLLLENAIKHNVISMAKPLQVVVFVQDGFVVVQNKYQPKLKPEKSTNIGLQNIRQRYQLLGAPAVLVEQTPEHFTVKIPLIDKEEDGRTDH